GSQLFPYTTLFRSGGAGDDAVEVVGVALGLHQRLPAAVGATGEVGVLGRLPVVGLGDRLGDERGDVLGPVGHVDSQLRVRVGPEGVSRVDADVAAVAGAEDDAPVVGGRASAGEEVVGVVGGGESAEASAAELHVASGPALLGEPEFELDLG